GQLGRQPADLRLARRMHGRVRGLREELRAETDPEYRSPQAEHPLEEEVLVPQPGMAVVLVGVHRAAECEYGAVLVEWPGERAVPGEAPLVELVSALLDHLAEDPRAHVVAVDHRQDVHRLTLAPER